MLVFDVDDDFLTFSHIACLSFFFVSTIQSKYLSFLNCEQNLLLDF